MMSMTADIFPFYPSDKQKRLRDRKICVRDSQCPDCLVLWHGSGDSCFSATTPHDSLTDWFISGTLYIAVAVIFLSFMIPLRLEFEAENARYANLIAVIIMLVLYTLLWEDRISAGSLTENAVAFFNGLGDMGIWICVMTAALVILIISYMCSRRIMEKKEF